MKDFLRTITIVLLALGLMGIILGISVGLYRNDQLAKMQEAGKLDSDDADQISGPADLQNAHGADSINNFLMQTNLHTMLLAAGTLLTLLSALLFLIGIDKKIG